MKLINVIKETDGSVINSYDAFISDYKLIYSKDVFVLFSSNKVYPSDSVIKSTDIPASVYFPMGYIKKNPSKAKELLEGNYMHVVRAKKSLLNVNSITLDLVKKLAQRMGLMKTDFSQFLHSFIDYKLKGVPVEVHMFITLLTNEVSILENNEVRYRKQPEMVEEKLKMLGYHGIYQEDDTYKNILHKSYYPVALIFSGTRLDKTYEYLKGSESVPDTAPLTFDDNFMRGVADAVAKGLGTTLNSDPTYSLFLDYYFWTKDGIELIITVAFETIGSTNSVYYIIEADTPYGVMVQRINPRDGVDGITRDIKAAYQSHVTPNEIWEPTNRDVFMDKDRRDYKLFDIHYKDTIALVDKYYPNMYRLARSFNVALPVHSYYSDFDKLYLHQFIEFLAENPTPAMTLMKELEESNYNFDDLFYVPMPHKITVDLLKSIATTYQLMKKRTPSVKGWYLFKGK